MNESSTNSNIISNPEVSINVVLSTPTMKISELSNIGTGEILKLQQAINDPLSVEVNGKVIARVELLSIDGCYAIKVKEIIGG